MAKWFQLSVYERDDGCCSVIAITLKQRVIFLQVKNWCFVTAKWLLYILSALMELEGRRRSTETERRPFEACCGSSWSPVNLAEEKLLCRGGFCDVSLLLFQLISVIFLKLIIRMNKTGSLHP